jgi:hypothetical protein
MKWKEGQQFENPPTGSHIARCYAVIDLGTQQHSWQGETWGSRDVRISFEMPLKLMTGKYNPEVKGKPFSIHLTVKQSLHSKAKLRPMLEGWRGRKFTKEELAGFDPKNLTGKPCRLALVEDGEYVNISSISPLGEGETCPPQVNPSVYLSLNDGEFDGAVFATLHDKTKEKIGKSPEYAALFADPSPGDQSDNDADASASSQQESEIPF